ncbi:type VII secretion protein EccE [Gordonia sp. ABSL1-1]|uniref:type VII secretion protein EccE n=1 Tax=Gordonia sp. ABSL1-1 TaxID=3053923 RepID=UPI0025733E42|nr:type VII secretion protein EccE [Gordonia sp. ABSL1-1]MDL9935651.1 type VII secretion protein EccE [Gordonia sp. ABSL1-1]
MTVSRIRPGTVATTVDAGVTIVAQVILAAGAIGWLIVGNLWGMTLFGLSMVAACTLVPVGDTGSAARRIRQRISFWLNRRRRGADRLPAPFDIPTGDDRSATGARAVSTIGTRWTGRTLITMLRIAPPATILTTLGPGHTAVADDTGQTIPLDVLADCINPYDIRLSSIEVVSHGRRIGGIGRAADVYARTVGPLPATARRSVLIVLRLDPLDCPDAVARRGGGGTGALRTATIATRRVAKRLTEAGLHVRPLTAAQITAVTAELLDGTDLDTVTESWTSLRGSATGGGPATHLTTGSVEPAQLVAALSAPWPAGPISVTTVLAMRHDSRGGLELRGVIRTATPAQTSTTPIGLPAGVRRLDGHQFDALVAGLPIETTAPIERMVAPVTGARASQITRELRLPAAGCGQLVGADRAGQGIAIRLIGADIAHVVLAAEFALTAQVVLRAVAIGAHVVVHSRRPQDWAPVIATVADLGALSLSTDRIPGRGALRAVVADGVDIPAPPPGTTRITVLPPGTAGRPPTDDIAPVTHSGSISIADADVVIRQNPRAPQEISIATRTLRQTVTMVATPAEWTMIGGHRTQSDRAGVTAPIALGTHAWPVGPTIPFRIAADTRR